jgi:hypothetical protein
MNLIARADLLDILWMLDSVEALKLVERYVRRPYLFSLDRCRTYDPKAPPDARAAQLVRESKALRAISYFWKKLVDFDVPKSRQVFCSWACSCCALWECLFHRGTVGYIISETDIKSRELVKRIQYMWDHLDDDQPVGLKHMWEVENYVDEFRVVSFMGRPWGSEVHSLPQNISAMRQYGGSWAWVDEAGEQPDFAGLIQAVSPAVARLICVGTIGNDSWQERCGYEELRAFEGPEVATPEPEDELSGMPQAA